MQDNEKPTSIAEYLDAVLLPTEEQRKILSTGVLRNPKFWQDFATAMLELALQSYIQGEISVHELLKAVDTTSIGCDVKQRLTLFGIAAAKAVTINPQKGKKRGPEFAHWQKNAVVELALLCEENGMTISPNSSESAITEAIALNSLMRIIPEGVNEQSVYKWVLEVKKERGMTINKTGPRLQTE